MRFAPALQRCYHRGMENRAYAFAFLAVLGIICLGAYVAISALFDLNGDPLIRFDNGNGAPTVVALGTRPAGTRTATPTITPFLFIIPTLVFPTPTPTPLPPTLTPTLPPLPTPRPLPTRTPTQQPGDSSTPGPPPTPTYTPVPGFYPFSYSGPSIEHRNCVSQYIIYGYVRDAQGQGMAGVRIRFSAKYPHPIDFPPASTRSGSEAGYYELTAGISGNEFDVTIIESSDRPLSPTVHVSTSGFDSGNCWYLLNWRRN
jgi:hypothetical protein